MSNFFKRKALLAVIGALLVFGGLLLIPSVWEKGEVESNTSDEGFTAFIPFTLGYFPEDFSIDQAGSDNLTDGDYALYREWYTSETHFIILVESMPSRLGEVDGEELVLKEVSATLVTNPNFEALTGGVLDFDDFDTNSTFQIIVFSEDIVVEVITNLPREEAIKAAESLIPTVCLNKPTETPGE
jgi:hypothetical protein